MLLDPDHWQGLMPLAWATQARLYNDARRKWATEINFPFPERRSRKRKPIPGTFDGLVADEEG